MGDTIEERLNDLEDWAVSPLPAEDDDTLRPIAARVQARRADVERPECEFEVGDRVWWNKGVLRAGVVEEIYWSSCSKCWRLSIMCKGSSWIQSAVDCHLDRPGCIELKRGSLIRYQDGNSLYQGRIQCCTSHDDRLILVVDCRPAADTEEASK